MVVEIAASSQSLSNVSGNLKELVGEFKTVDSIGETEEPEPETDQKEEVVKNIESMMF